MLAFVRVANLPIGSVPPPGAANRMAPGPMKVCGTMSVSTTLVHALGLSEAKYAAAARVSSSWIACAKVIMLPDRTPLRCPFLNSAIWRMM